MPDGTAYTVEFARAKVSLHVANYPEGCRQRFADYAAMVRSDLAKLRSGTLDQSQFIPDPSSTREIVVGGYPAVEHVQEIVKEKLKSYERWQCVGTRFYIFSAAWPRGEQTPPEVARLVNSFRLLPN